MLLIDADKYIKYLDRKEKLSDQSFTDWRAHHFDKDQKHSADC